MLNIAMISIWAFIGTILGFVLSIIFGRDFTRIIPIIGIISFGIYGLFVMADVPNLTPSQINESIWDIFMIGFSNILSLMFGTLLGVIIASFLGKNPQDYY